MAARQRKKPKPNRKGSPAVAPGAPRPSARESEDRSSGGRNPWLLVRLFLAAAALLSGYLLNASLRGGGLAGCGAGSGCNEVLSSQWAYWFGWPVSAPALVVYLLLFGLTFRAGPRPPGIRVIWQMIGGCALLILGAGAWFIFIQAAVIHRVCPYCLAAHLCAMVAAGLAVRQIQRTVRDQAQQTPARKGGVAGTRFWATPAAAAVVGGAVLLWGETARQPRKFEVSSVPAQAVIKPASAAQKREIELFNGGVRVKLDEVPLIGTLQAPDAMVSLFDYTCHHCRLMHGVLLHVQQVYSNRLVIANLPMPLDGHCNPVMKRTPAAHVNACEYARLGLAIWRANRTKLSEFDHWIFEPATPPGVAEARSYAENLVGAEALERALADPWVEAQLRQDISIYETNYRNLGRGVMPQLIISTNMVFGVLERPGELEAILKRSFGW